MERYEIVLAAPFEDCETDGHKFPFYEKLEHSLSMFEKRLFLPHKQLARLDNPFPVAEEAIRGSELVLIDTGIHSDAAGMMLQTAIDYSKPIISFRDLFDPYDGKSDRILEGALNRVRAKRIGYRRDEDGLGMIVGAIREFYGPLLPGYTD